MDRIVEAMRKLHPVRIAAKDAVSNAVTQMKKEVAVDRTVTVQRRDELVEEARKYLTYDQYYEWNANINGIIIQLRTNVPHLYDFWMDNWYPAQLETDLEPHGIVYAVTGIPGRDPSAFYNSETKTGVIFNSSYYGQCRALALGIAADIAERQFSVQLVRGSCLEVAGNGVVLLSTSGAGRPTITYSLLELDESRFHSDDCLFIRHRGASALADISERKFYVRTNLTKNFPKLARHFYKSKCENVIMRRADCTDKSCMMGAECPLDLGDPYCFYASKSSRALLDPYWIKGPDKYVKRTAIKYLFLLKKDAVSPAIQELAAEDALKVLQEGEVSGESGKSGAAQEKQPFFNPYLLALNDERMELQKKFFTKLLQQAPCYLVNTGAEETSKILARIRMVLLGR
jgi:hypothetical protein